jgi:hypothetical protein
MEDVLSSIGVEGYLTPSDFDKIYQMNLFGSAESRSGGGSTMEQTANIRDALSSLFKSLGIKSLLDVPCGDFNWMRHLDLSGISYVGGDIVGDCVTSNIKAYAGENVQFQQLDIVTDDLPKSDLIICRDCLVHLRFADSIQALKNFKSSGAKYMLLTTFPEHSENTDQYRFWRPLNMENAPFNLGPAVQTINESCTEIHRGKVCFFYQVTSLPRTDNASRGTRTKA